MIYYTILHYVRCPNTLMTPHVGGSTEEAQAKIGEEVAERDSINYNSNSSKRNSIIVLRIQQTQ